jgi:hypothetical protein
MHDALASRVERRQAALEAEYSTVGVCQNQWKMVYLFTLVGLVAASCAVLFWLFHFVKANEVNCKDDKAFLAITFLAGVALLFMSGECVRAVRGACACTGPRGEGGGRDRPLPVCALAWWPAVDAVGGSHTRTHEQTDS